MANRSWRGAALAAAIILFSIAWLGSNPPGGAPDETSHFIRALAVGRGHFAGKPAVPFPEDEVLVLSQVRIINNAERLFMERATWIVTVPAELSPPRAWGCTAHHPDRTAACLFGDTSDEGQTQRLTYTGTFDPLLYLAPGWLADWATSPEAALYIARGANALICLIFLLLAQRVLATLQQPVLTRLGLIAALSPMVFFLTASLSLSGPEIASAVCLLACCFALTRAEPPSRATWPAILASSVVLAGGRPLGPLWLLTSAIVFALLAGKSMLRLLFQSRYWLIATSIGVAAASAFNLVWQFSSQRHPLPSAAEIPSMIRASLWMWPISIRDAIGTFGSLEVVLPLAFYGIGMFSVLALSYSAFRACTGSQRATMGFFILLVVVSSSLVEVLAILPSGYGMQGRYLMPVFVIVPLAAGEFLARNAYRFKQGEIRLITAVVVGCCILLNVGSLYVNWTRYAVGAHHAGFSPFAASWVPPGGYAVWFAVTLLAAACLAAFAWPDGTQAPAALASGSNSS